jgi:hypothetical protein
LAVLIQPSSIAESMTCPSTAMVALIDLLESGRGHGSPRSRRA